MPYYRIDIVLRASKPPARDKMISVVRQYNEPDIEKVWHILEVKSRLKWDSRLKEFNCVQVSKRSADYQAYLKNHGKAGDADECAGKAYA